MPAIVSLTEAKARLSELVERAAAGEEIIIAEADKPLARLTALQSEKKKAAPTGHSEGYGVDRRRLRRSLAQGDFARL